MRFGGGGGGVRGREKSKCHKNLWDGCYKS